MVLSWDLDKNAVRKSAREQLPYISKMATWELQNTKKALTGMRALNTLEEEGRLFAVNNALKSRKRLL